MPNGNKPTIHTTIDKKTKEQIQELIDIGAYGSKTSIIIDAIDKLHREKTARIKLHPKAARIVQRLKRNQDDEYTFEQIANQMIINHTNQQTNNEQDN